MLGGMLLTGRAKGWDWGLGVGGWGLEIGDWGLEIGVLCGQVGVGGTWMGWRVGNGVGEASRLSMSAVARAAMGMRVGGRG